MSQVQYAPSARTLQYNIGPTDLSKPWFIGYGQFDMVQLLTDPITRLDWLRTRFSIQPVQPASSIFKTLVLYGVSCLKQCSKSISKKIQSLSI